MSACPNVKQLFSWDCGLACVVAVRSLHGGLSCPTLLASLAESFPDKSVWTIDLALLLHSTNKIRFYTVYAGVNPTHASMGFYEHLSRDEPRITKAFQTADVLGVEIRLESIGLDYICDRLAAGLAVFIVLVDLRWLRCLRCTSSLRMLQFFYAGHYVLLWRYNRATRTLLYMDPAAACG
jgi:uncharacterized protein YneR